MVVLALTVLAALPRYPGRSRERVVPAGIRGVRNLSSPPCCGPWGRFLRATATRVNMASDRLSRLTGGANPRKGTDSTRACHSGATAGQICGSLPGATRRLIRGWAPGRYVRAVLGPTPPLHAKVLDAQPYAEPGRVGSRSGPGACARHISPQLGAREGAPAAPPSGPTWPSCSTQALWDWEMPVVTLAVSSAVVRCFARALAGDGVGVPARVGGLALVVVLSASRSSADGVTRRQRRRCGMPTDGGIRNRREEGDASARWSSIRGSWPDEAQLAQNHLKDARKSFRLRSCNNPHDWGARVELHLRVHIGRDAALVALHLNPLSRDAASHPLLGLSHGEDRCSPVIRLQIQSRSSGGVRIRGLSDW